MKIYRISKRNGKHRTIYAPDPTEKDRLYDLLPEIAQAAEQDGSSVQHGFRAGRSPVTNALRHVGYAHTLSMDLTDFFDSVTPAHVPESLRFPECFPCGAARQGLPTSPALANIAAQGLDADILASVQRGSGRMQRVHETVVYTRYADDLTLSSDDIDALRRLSALIPQLAERHGFRINPAKTHMQSSRQGRRHVTGIAVDYDGIHPTRQAKRRLRAARHQRHSGEARGLAEWIALRPPKVYRDQKPGSRARPLANDRACFDIACATGTRAASATNIAPRTRIFDLD